MRGKNLFLLMGGISFVALIISLTLLLGDHFEIKSCGCPKMISQHFVWLFIILAVLFVGSLVYYLFSLEIDKKEKIISRNLEVLTSILDEDEKAVLDLIVMNKGRIEQARISEKYGKIKAHRILKKLSQKNIIDLSKDGKTNTVHLKNELKEELVK